MRDQLEGAPVAVMQGDGADWDGCGEASLDKAAKEAPVKSGAQTDKSLDDVRDECIKSIVNRGEITEAAFDAIAKELREKDINRSELLARIDEGLLKYGMHLEVQSTNHSVANRFTSKFSIALKEDNPAAEEPKTIKTWPVRDVVSEYDSPIDDTSENHFIDYDFSGSKIRRSH